MSMDINLTNVTVLTGSTVYRFDTRELYHIHRVYEIKDRRSRGFPYGTGG